MKHTGFTLIELLTVVLIIGVLTSIALPQYRKSLDRSKVAEAVQLLPALLESRDRWIIENGYHWEDQRIYDMSDDPVNPDLDLLDIEVKGVLTSNPPVFTTRNFSYNLRDTRATVGTAAVGVSAAPLWGGSRNLTQVGILYQGRSVCCVETNQATGTCERLNVDLCPQS